MAKRASQVASANEPTDPLPIPTSYRIVITALPGEKRIKVDLIFLEPAYVCGQVYATFTLSPQECRAFSRKLDDALLNLAQAPQARIA